jgi:hypothetical protein
MNDIAVDGQGDMYAVDGGGFLSGSSLYRVDRSTGGCADVGSVGFFVTVNALAFSPDGRLYAAGDGALYSINTQTGAGHYIGDLGGLSSAGDLEFDSAGHLYLTTTSGQLAQVNPTTGSASIVGATGYSDVFGLAYDPGSNVMYGLADSAQELLTINLATGAATELSSLSGQGTTGAFGATYYQPAPAVVEGPVTDPSNGHQYYIVSAGSWTQAQSEAQSIGGNLATIRSSAENAWIVTHLLTDYPGATAPKLSDRPVWIGLYDPTLNPIGNANPSNFVWASGEPVTYTDWPSWEPDKWGGTEFYTAIQWNYARNDSPDRGAWNDCPVGGTFGFPGDTDGPYYGIAEVATTVTVTSPNGGETWGAGSSRTITWSVNGNASRIASFLVSYSLDGGATYLSDVGTVSSADRSISWKPPLMNSPTAALRIRVEALDAGGSVLYKDASDGNFALARVVGYLPDSAYGSFHNGDIDPTAVTNIDYFNIDAKATGDLIPCTALFLSHLDDVVANMPAESVSITVGEWGAAYFDPIARSAVARANFAQQLLAFCNKHDLGGVDLDWEQVSNADVPYYGDLISDLHSVLAPQGLLLSAAVNSFHKDIPASAASNLAWVALMDYDMNPSGSPYHALYSDAVKSIDSWASYGVPKYKLLMGVPFYGKNSSGGTVSYGHIISDYAPTSDQDYAGKYSYNGITTVKNKVDYVYGNGFGGMMIWQLGQDDFGSKSLLAAMNSEDQRFLTGQVPTASVTAPTSVQTGDVSIGYTLIDADSNPCQISMQYSINGGLTWATATADTGGEGVSGLSSSPAGTQHTFVWNSSADLAKVTVYNVQMRITPGNADGAGIAGTSGSFAVNYVDLTGTLGTSPVLPSSVVANAKFAGTLSVTVTNSGNVPLPANQQVNIELWAYDTATAAKSLLGTLKSQSVSKLGANKSLTFRPSVTAGTVLAEGDYQVWANIVPVKPLAELNSDNNWANATAAGQPEPLLSKPPFVDLAASFAKTLTAWTGARNSGDGKTISVPVVVTNVGNVPLDPSLKISIQINAVGAGLTTVPLKTLTGVSVASLGNGKSVATTTTVTLPPGMPTGDYNLQAIVDTTDVVTGDTNLPNNTFQTAGSLTVTTGYLDLTGTFGSSTLKATIAHGAALTGTVAVSLKNIGKVALPVGQTADIALVAVNASSVTTPLNTLSGVSLTALAANAAKSFSIPVSLLGGLAAGVYTLEATVTLTNNQSEFSTPLYTVLTNAAGKPLTITVT